MKLAQNEDKNALIDAAIKHLKDSGLEDDAYVLKQIYSLFQL